MSFWVNHVDTHDEKNHQTLLHCHGGIKRKSVLESFFTQAINCDIKMARRTDKCQRERTCEQLVTRTSNGRLLRSVNTGLWRLMSARRVTQSRQSHRQCTAPGPTRPSPVWSGRDRRSTVKKSRRRVTHSADFVIPRLASPHIGVNSRGWEFASLKYLTHFAQSSKMGTVTKGFDARLANRPLLVFDFLAL